MRTSWKEKKTYSSATDDRVVIEAVKTCITRIPKDVSLMEDRGRCLPTHPQWQTVPGAWALSLCTWSCLPDGHRSLCPGETQILIGYWHTETWAPRQMAFLYVELRFCSDVPNGPLNWNNHMNKMNKHKASVSGSTESYILRTLKTFKFRHEV